MAHGAAGLQLAFFSPSTRPTLLGSDALCPLDGQRFQSYPSPRLRRLQFPATTAGLPGECVTRGARWPLFRGGACPEPPAHLRLVPTAASEPMHARGRRARTKPASILSMPGAWLDLFVWSGSEPRRSARSVFHTRNKDNRRKARLNRYECARRHRPGRYKEL
jgi:hypothetical protein